MPTKGEIKEVSKKEMEDLIEEDEVFKRIMFKLSKAGADTEEISQDWEVQALICREDDELAIFNFFGGTKWLEKECYLGERVGTFHTHGKRIFGGRLNLSLGDVLASMEAKDNLVCVGEVKEEEPHIKCFFASDEDIRESWEKHYEYKPSEMREHMWKFNPYEKIWEEGG